MRQSGLASRPLVSHYVLSWLVALTAVLIGLASFILDPPSSGALATMGRNILAGGGYPNILTILIEAIKTPLLSTVFLYAAAPSIAALIVAGRGGGGGLARLLSRFNPIGPDGERGRSLRLYMGLLLIYGLGFAVYAFNAGPGVDVTQKLKWLGGNALGGAALGLFIDEGGSLEELGWRGFEWPLLSVAIKRPATAALLLGALHWAWHLPREIPGLLGGVALNHWAVGQVSFLVLCLALSVVAVFCVNQTGGSVWPAIFVHGGTNVWSKAAGWYVGPTFGQDLRTLLVVAIALIILAFAGRRLGLKAEAVLAASKASGEIVSARLDV